MRRNPPDILITTPESLYLMLTSQAREMLTDVEAVIVDEIHAVAATKRGAHLALTLERLAAQQADGRDPQRIGLSATQNPLEEVGRFLVGPRRDVHDRRRRRPQARSTSRSRCRSSRWSSRSRRPPADRSTRWPAARRRASSIWPAIYPQILELVREHRSTIVFVNNRRGAERLALRLNELAEEDIARAHHGSLAREERLVVEEMLKAGELPCLVATSSLELGIDMGAVDLVLQVESPKSVVARPAAHRPRRPRRRRRRRRAGSSRSSAPTCSSARSSCKLMREGQIEPTVVPRNALDVLAQHIVAIAARGGAGAGRRSTTSTRSSRARTPTPSCRARCSRTCSTCSTAATRRSEFGELRPRIVWDRVGGHDPRAQGLAPARRHQRGHDPRPRPVQRHAARRPPRRRARRGDGLRGAARPDVPARRVDVADRGDRPRPRDRHPRARARRARCRSGRATASGGRRSSARRSARSARWAVDQPAEMLERDYDLDPLAAKNLLDYLREQQEATRVVPSDRTIVIERFRDEIGDWRLCILSPFGGRVHAAVGAGAERADPRRVRPGVRRDLVRRRDHRPPPRRRRAARRGPRADRPRRARGPRRRRARRQRAVRRALPRERRRVAADPARLPGQAHAAVAAAAEGAVAARGRQALRRLPDHPRDLPRVPARRARPAGPAGPAARRCTAASCRSSRSRRRPRRRSPRRCCSTTSRRTCTRATRPTPSGARRRCRSTATCCASCSARRSCATSSTPTRSSRSRTTCSTAPSARARRRATRCTTCCAASAT